MANFKVDYSQTVCTGLKSLQVVAMHKLHSRDSAHGDLGVKLSPCMCSPSNCPDRQWTVTSPVVILVWQSQTQALSALCRLLPFMICVPDWRLNQHNVLLAHADSPHDVEASSYFTQLSAPTEYLSSTDIHTHCNWIHFAETTVLLLQYTHIPW